MYVQIAMNLNFVNLRGHLFAWYSTILYNLYVYKCV